MGKGDEPAASESSGSSKKETEMRKLQSGKYFTSTAPNTGTNQISDSFWFIENFEYGKAIDEYGDTETGFICDARPATDEEIQTWKDKRRNHRAGRSVLQMMEDYEL